MTFTSVNVELSTEGFATRAELTAYVHEKSAKLLRHSHPRVQVAKFHVKRETPHSSAAFFAVRGVVEHGGIAHVVHADGAEPEVAIHAAIAKLERALTSDVRIKKHQLHAGATGGLEGTELEG